MCESRQGKQLAVQVVCFALFDHVCLCRWVPLFSTAGPFSKPTSFPYTFPTHSYTMTIGGVSSSSSSSSPCGSKKKESSQRKKDGVVPLLVRGLMMLIAGLGCSNSTGKASRGRSPSARVAAVIGIVASEFRESSIAAIGDESSGTGRWTMGGRDGEEGASTPPPSASRDRT